MTRTTALIALLAALNVCSALAVVYSKHLSRLQFIEISEQQNEIGQLDVEWSQLQIEESTFSEHGLVERLASEQLGMRFPDMAETVLIAR